ncbi:MAG: hypothetical protein KDD13_11120 [Mangrovimonas sp.]|nr:hypothetical protein [Mangrovimonas sp.]MCB9303657.1 hypothetical protein [Lewinellaceae bacterium]
MKFVDGVYNPSYFTLGHELYHAYQDEVNAKRNYLKQTEADAMKFENYLRDVFDQGPHRTKHGGVPHLSSVTAFSSNGEEVDVNSVSVTTYFLGGSSSSGIGGSPQDNVNNGTSIAPIVIKILEYMDNNGLQRLTLNFDQRDKDKNKKRP